MTNDPAFAAALRIWQALTEGARDVHRRGEPLELTSWCWECIPLDAETGVPLNGPEPVHGRLVFDYTAAELDRGWPDTGSPPLDREA